MTRARKKVPNKSQALRTYLQSLSEDELWNLKVKTVASRFKIAPTAVYAERKKVSQNGDLGDFLRDAKTIKNIGI